MQKTEMNNTSVWVVTAGWDYEGEDILGVFSSKENAKNAVANIKVRPARGYKYDFLDITEYEVDEL